MNKTLKIFLQTVPVPIMIGLIPLIRNDHFLTLAYIVIIVIMFMIQRTKDDLKIFIFGFIAMTISESVFVSTGVEVFQRNSLFGLMPLWLPFLWAYGFVVIKRSIEILNA